MVVLHLSDVFLDFSTFWTLQVAGVEHHSGFEMHNDLIKKHRLLVSITSIKARPILSTALGGMWSRLWKLIVAEFKSFGSAIRTI
jgi:hypothetical protein